MNQHNIKLKSMLVSFYHKNEKNINNVMDKISLLYENKLFGDNLVRHDVMQEFQRCVAYENYEKISFDNLH